MVEMDTDLDPYLDPDRQYLEADPDPAKWCRSEPIRIHNTVKNTRNMDIVEEVRNEHTKQQRVPKATTPQSCAHGPIPDAYPDPEEPNQ
jgi:hypothetical protein